ncbi:MAG: hypothetical protein LBR47_06660, partial [Spirochaetaceae bacterium]|nr:hypothetical protein [Spirochaetaceae bacterium]
REKNVLFFSEIEEMDYPAALALVDEMREMIPEGSSPPREYTDALNTMIQTFSSIQRICVSSLSPTVRNTPFKDPFILKMTAPDGSPIAALPVEIYYPVSGYNNKYEFASETVLTGDDGTVVFQPPIPSFSCNTTISTRIALNSSIPEIQGILSELTEGSEWKVSTSIKGKPVVIALVDFEKDNTPIITNNKTATALLSVFMKNGYARMGLADFTSPIAAGNDEAVYKEAKRLLGNEIPYMIYGTVKYNKIEQTDAGYYIGLTASVKAMDLIHKTLLYETEVTMGASGRTETMALNNARQILAREGLFDKLIYGI